MTWTKICGTTSLADANIAVAAGADAVGFIFAPSPRQIPPDAAAGIIEALPAKIAKIGVTVNQSPDELARLVENVGLTGIQLQGDELGEELHAYRSALRSRMIIKTLHVQQLLAAGDEYLDEYLRAAECIDAVLLDSGTPGQRGGTGTTFGWNAVAPLVSRIKQRLPVIVAGGLTPENVGNAIQVFAPWGVDVVSGVESQPGRKEEAKVRGFVSAVRNAPVLTASPTRG